MLKKSLLVFVLFFFMGTIMMVFVSQPKRLFNLCTIAYGQNFLPDLSHHHDVIKHFKPLALQQLLDTANHYFDRISFDTALICYNLLIKYPAKDSDFLQPKRMVEAYNKSAAIYYLMSDHRTAYELYIEALFLCEKHNFVDEKSKIYANIGNIYARFQKYDLAKLYYSNALDLCQDSTIMVILLNNLGDAELKSDNMDSAYYYLNKALQISKQHDHINSHLLLNTTGSYYQKLKLYDSAYYYYKLSINEAQKINRIRKEAEYLSTLSKMFCETRNKDSAIVYIELSNDIAKEHDLLEILSDNYLILSKIEETKGHTKNALEYFKKHAQLRDSILNTEIFGDIAQLQHSFELSKTHQQIEQLVVEQQINERTIYYQRIFWLFTLLVLILVSIVLVVIFLQKRRLDTAYKSLFEKNMEIMELEEESSEKEVEKYKNSNLSDELQEELLNRILKLMKNTSIICDAEFSLDRLAELVQSNHNYVSQVINNALKKNFRSFLNGYRIKEAQRIYAELDTTRYTVESVAFRVGFKSPSAFRSIFKEITGVSPGYYLKAMQKKSGER